MAKKLFNIILGLALILVVALFVYKTTRQPQVISSDVPTSNNQNISDESQAKSVNSVLSKEELNAAIKEYLINNPETIIASLEGMQLQKEKEDAGKANSYLMDNKDDVENAESPPVLGNKDGDISIVVFYDYNCSYCKKAHDYNNEVLSLDPGVKLILRPMPILGKTSAYAAQVALAVQKVSQDQFAAVHNDMMKMQLINEAGMKELLSKYNIDYSLVENEINSNSVRQQISKNFDLAKGLGIKGAPSYVINGNLASGLIPVEKFKNIIEQIRSSTKAKNDA
ncbi:MAG: DsbA family protein [Rickettsiaceae bacterium]|nr:DsbA family protein [Rickettsiaceae bacterium]